MMSQTRNGHNSGFVPAAGWRWLTPLYDCLCACAGLGTSFKRRMVTLAHIAPDDRVLDVGCGTGTLAILLAQSFPSCDVVALDPDPQVLAIARQKAERRGIRVSFIQARAESIPFADCSFDVVFSTLMLHHLSDDRKTVALQEIHRLLDPKGRLLLADFDSSQSLMFIGKYRSRRRLAEWISQAGLLPSSIERRRGVHIFECQRDNGSPAPGTS